MQSSFERSSKKSLDKRKVVGGAFDKEGILESDPSKIPGDIMTPLGELCNLINPAVQKGLEQRKKSLSPDQQQALEAAHLTEIRRALLYWSRDEEAALKVAETIDIQAVKEAFTHVTEGGRMSRALARSVVKETAIQPQNREQATDLLSKNPDFQKLLSVAANAPDSKSMFEVNNELVERTRKVTEDILSKAYPETAGAVWINGTPDSYNLSRAFKIAHQQEIGLTGVANRLFHKTGGLELMSEAAGGPIRFPSDSIGTALKTAQMQYMQAVKTKRDTFLFDASFKSETGGADSVGFATSKLLLALDPAYEEYTDSSISDGIVELKKSIAGAVDRAAYLANHRRMSPDESLALKGILNNLGEKFAKDTYKEATKLARESKKADEETLKETMNAIKSGKAPQMQTEAFAPDSFARLQRAFTEILVEKLRNNKNETIADMIRTVSNGKLKEIKVTGVWRDWKAAEAVDSLGENADIGTERLRSEQFINNLPYIARNAAEKNKELPAEQKNNIRATAQALYELVDEIRSKRLQDNRAVEKGKKSSAKESANLNLSYSQLYRMLLKYNLIRFAPEPFEEPERAEGQTEEEYANTVVFATAAYDKRIKTEEVQFNTNRNTALHDHLTKFLEKMDSSSPLKDNLVGSMGGILGYAGMELKAAMKERIQEVLARPIIDRFKRRTPASEWQWKDQPSYVVVDESTNKRLQPPEHMRAAIDEADSFEQKAKTDLKVVFDRLTLALTKIYSDVIPADERTAKELDVLEFDLNDLYTSGKVASVVQSIQKFSDGPGTSLAAKSIHATKSRLTNIIAEVSRASEEITNARKALLLKFVRQTRKELDGAYSPDSEEHRASTKLLDEFELLGRRGEVSELKDAIQSFI